MIVFIHNITPLPAQDCLSTVTVELKNMVEQQKRAAMNSLEQAAVDEHFRSLPDTTFIKNSIMDPPKTMPDYYAMAIINVRDLENMPLQNKTVTITLHTFIA